MAMKRCPICGEKYSDTYRSCPFCEEEEALREGEAIRRTRRKGRRSAGVRSFSLITPTLIVLIIIMASLLIYLLYGDKLTGKSRGEDQPDKPATEEVVPNTPVEPEIPDVPEDPAGPEDSQTGVMPEDPGTETTTPDTPDTPDEPEGDYELAMKLPDGLSLSTTDFTLRKLGETHTIQVSGGSGSYEWISQDPGVASVDQNGKVIAISGGTVNVVATDGNKKAACIVRVTASGTFTPEPSTPGGSESSTSGGLKAGEAQVVNGGNGVRVRSGPGTNYDILATVPNGASIKIVESAGNDWYKITFDDVGGVSKPGYMKGEFLANK